MPAIDAQARELVSAEQLMATCTALCALGEKVAGSAEEGKACDILTDALTRYGITHTVHRFQSYVSYPISAALSLSAKSGGFDVEAVGVAFGLSTPRAASRPRWSMSETGWMPTMSARTSRARSRSSASCRRPTTPWRRPSMARSA